MFSFIILSLLPPMPYQQDLEYTVIAYRWARPSKNKCSGYDTTKLHQMVRFLFWRSEEYEITFSLPLLPGPL